METRTLPPCPVFPGTYLMLWMRQDLMIPFPVAPSTPTIYAHLNASQKAKAKQQHGLTPGCPSASHQVLSQRKKVEARTRQGGP